MTSWLSDASANRHIKTYVKDFLDLSGNLTVRNNEDYDWNSYGQVLSGNYESDGNVYFGMSVAMDASGTTIVTSAPEEDNGAVRAYRYDSTAEVWYQLGDNIHTAYIKRVAISDDGSRVVAFKSNAGVGDMGFHVYDYDASSNSWTNVGSVSVAIGHQEQSGYISGDGNTIVVANNSDDTNGTNSGETNIYRYAGSGTWNLIGTFRGDGTVTNMHNSTDACTSFDGNRVALSEKGGTNTSGTVTGRVTIYDYGGGASWTQVGSTIYGDTATQKFGETNSFSKDGSIFAVGGSQVNSQVRVYQYSSSASDWVQLGSTIFSDETNFGYGVRLSQDGTTVIINSVETSSASNKIFAFEYINGDWVTKGSLFIGRFADNSVGYGGATGTQLDINEDGTKIVVGGSAADLNGTNSGVVQAFQWSNKTYVNPMLDISGGAMTVWGGAEENANNWSVTNVTTFQDGTDSYGLNMKFNADGTIMVVGEPFYNGDAGRIHAYKYRSGSWNKMGSDVADSNIYYDGFSLGINDSGLIIGSASGKDGDEGMIVWEFINGDWSVKGGLISNNNITKIGHRGLSFNGEGNIVAGKGEEGAAVYQYNSGSWNQLGSDFTGLITNGGANEIALNQAGNIVAITDPGYDSPSTDAGRVGIFQYDSSNNWVQLGDWITAPSTSGGSGDHYGTTVSLSSDGYIVAFGTAIGSDATTDYHARIFQYVPSVGQWTPRSPDVQNDNVTTAAGAGAKVGSNVALSGDGNTLVVNDNDSQTASGVYGGAVHVFKYIDGLYKWVTRLDGQTDSNTNLSGSVVAISRDGTRVGGSRGSTDYVRIGDIVNNPALKIENGSTIMNGNVGIGKDSPTTKLDVYGGRHSEAGTDFIGARVSAEALEGTGNTSSSIIKLDRSNYGGAIGGYLTQGTGGGLTLSTMAAGTLTERMRINNNGSVGIGTDNPHRQLTIYHSSNPAIQLINDSGGTAGTDGMALEQYLLSTYFTNKENGNIHFRTQHDTIRMTIQENGYIGIGNTAPSYKLHVSGSLFVDAYGTGQNVSFRQDQGNFLNTKVNDYTQSANNYLFLVNGYGSTDRFAVKANGAIVQNGSTIHSDDRIKENEEYITNATETLMKLKPQIYDKMSSLPSDEAPPTKLFKESGLIAQEVYYDAPELRHIVYVPPYKDASGNSILDASGNAMYPDLTTPINTSDDPSIDPDYSIWGNSLAGLSYTQLIPYLIKSNQEQQEEINTLKTQLTDVLSRLSALESA